MKVPVYEQQVAPQSAPMPVANVRPINDAGLREGLASLDRAGGEIAAKYQANVEKEKQKAVAADVTDAETQLSRAATSTLYGQSAEEGDQAQPGFLSLKGRDAESLGVTAYERISQAREEIAKKLNSTEAQTLFRQRSGGHLEDYRRTIESHVSQQRQVADVATLNARQAAALDEVRANPNNLTAVERQATSLEGPIKMLSLSPEDAAADLKKWHGTVAAAQIDSQLAKGDWQSAETTLKNRGTVLSQKDFDTLSRATDKAKVSAVAEATASGIVQKSLRPDGSLNDRGALDALEKVPPDIADNVRPILYRRMTEAEQAFKAESARVSQKAFSSFNANGWGGIPEGLKEQLNQRNPELYDRLKNEDRRRFKQTRSDSAEARREQTLLNRDAMNDFKALPVDQQATVDLSPNGEFAQAHPGVDVHGFKAIAPVQRAAGDTVTKGQAEPMNQFVGDATANAEAWLQPGRTPAQKQARTAAMQDIKSKAVDAWNDWREGHNGKPPSATEAKKLIGGIVSGLTPKNEAQAKAAADAIVKQGNPSKPSKRDRALALKREGRSNADIAKQLTQEGY